MGWVRSRRPRVDLAKLARLRRPRVDQSGPKSSLGGSKIDPRKVQNRTPEGPKSSQERPGGSRSGPERPQSVPRASKSVPRASQEYPKSVPRAPKSAPRRASERPETPGRSLGDPFESRKFAKSAFPKRSFARLARKARSARFSVDFRSVRASAGMRKT